MTGLARQIGDWTLGDQLGRGGNATVWRASRPGDDQDVALKVLNTTKADREPYRRFTREIRFLQEHQEAPGVLPLIDANLPEAPTRTNPAWLAMPVAVPIARALEGRALPDVVQAMTAIARTLASLEGDWGIAHRDIKPSNLYEYQGKWSIGDFGLIALPDADTLTAQGRQVGPAHYTAYEMILDPTSADPHLADVYSLGKTIWVLATGQAWPPEGHQPADSRGFQVGDFRPHPYASVLDREIDLMTRLHPEDRPSKAQVAKDLAAWGELAGAPVVLDISAAQAQLRLKLKSAIAEQDTREQQKELAYAAVRRLQDLTAPLNASLKELYPRALVDSQSDKMTQNLLTADRRYHHDLLFRWQRCTFLAPFERVASTSLRMSRALELYDDGKLYLLLMVHVGPEGTMGSYFDSQIEIRSAPVGSVEQEKMLEDGVRDLADALRAAIDVFVENQPETG